MIEINMMTPANLANFKAFPRSSQVKVYEDGRNKYFGTVINHRVNLDGELLVVVEVPSFYQNGMTWHTDTKTLQKSASELELL